MTPYNTRPATAEELRVFSDWQKTIVEGRRAIEAMIAGASACARLEVFRRDRVPLLEPVITRDEADRVTAIVRDWNQIERLKSAVDLQQLAFRLSSSGRDLDVVQSDEGMEPFEGLGNPLVALVVVVVVVAAVISVSQGLGFAAKQSAVLHRTAMTKFAADMAKQPEPIRRAFLDLMNSPAMKQEEGILDGFFGKLGSVLPLLAVGLGLYLLWPMLSDARREARRAPESNPCGGDPRTPEQWRRVRWSRDPRKAERQLGYIIDDPRNFKDLSGWRGYFSQGMTEADFGDEVPF